jgi:uncharacterized membrane protein
MVNDVHTWIEFSATAIEALAVAIICGVVVAGTFVYAAQFLLRRSTPDTYTDFRHLIGRAMLLGLEILVAADVIRTIALEPSLQNVLILGLLIIIRTFLSWSLVLEIEGRWPWQPATKEQQPFSSFVPKLSSAPGLHSQSGGSRRGETRNRL